jgi:hypothetical protein
VGDWLDEGVTRIHEENIDLGVGPDAREGAGVTPFRPQEWPDGRSFFAPSGLLEEGFARPHEEDTNLGVGPDAPEVTEVTPFWPEEWSDGESLFTPGELLDEDFQYERSQ